MASESLKNLEKTLTPERVQVIVDLSRYIGDIHSSAVTVFGVGPAKVIDQLGMLLVNQAVRLSQTEQGLESVIARLDGMVGTTP